MVMVSEWPERPEKDGRVFMCIDPDLDARFDGCNGLEMTVMAFGLTSINVYELGR